MLLFFGYCADRKSPCARREPAFCTRISVTLCQSHFVRFGQALVEAPDAGIVEISRLMEPHYDGTGMVLLHHSRRIFCCTDRAMSGDEQRNNRCANDHWSDLGLSAEPIQRITPSRVRDIRLDEMRHLATPFAGTVHREAPVALLRWPTNGTMCNTSDVVLKMSNY
jgi:hypothetical protein